MNNTKLYLLVSTLSENQLMELEEFLELSSNGLSQKQILILNFLIEKLLKGDRNISKEEVINALTPIQDGIDKHWKQHLSKCYEVVKRYILFSFSNTDKFPEGEFFADYYVEKSLGDKMLKGLLKRLERSLDKPGNRDYYYHLRKFQIYQWQAMSKKIDATTGELLKSGSDALDLFYVENKLRIYLEILTQGVDHKQHYYDHKMELLNAVDNEKIEDLGAKIFHLFFQKQLANDFTGVEKIIEEIIANNHLFEKFYQKSILEQLLNFCTHNINKKQVDFAGHYLKIIELLDESGLLLDGSFIQWQRFKNIVTAALIQKDSQLASFYIDKYMVHLIPEKKEQAALLANAQIAHQQGDLDKVLKRMALLTTKGAIELVDYGRLILKVYFQKKEYIALRNFSKTMRTYLNRSLKKEDGVSELMYDRVRNLISLILALVNEKKVEEKTIETTILYGVDYLWLMNQVINKNKPSLPENT